MPDTFRAPDGTARLWPTTKAFGPHLEITVGVAPVASPPSVAVFDPTAISRCAAPTVPSVVHEPYVVDAPADSHNDSATDNVMAGTVDDHVSTGLIVNDDPDVATWVLNRKCTVDSDGADRGVHGVVIVGLLPACTNDMARFHTVVPPSRLNSISTTAAEPNPASDDWAIPISVQYDVPDGDVPPDVHDDHVSAAVEWVSDAEFNVWIDDWPCTVWAGEVNDTAVHADPL